MLTSPKEIVPLQIARCVRAAVPDLGSVRVTTVPDLCAVLCAIRNILDSLRAVGGLASRLVGGRLPRRLERAAQGIGEPPFTGDQGADLGDDRLAAAGRRRLARDRAPWAPMGRLAAGARLGIPRADLLHYAVHCVSPWRALRRLSNRPWRRATPCRAGRPASARRTAPRHRFPGRDRPAGGNLGDQATRRRGLCAVARITDGGDDRRLHLG